ncbi:MAG: tape measure protein [Acutalibacteraceae bacterium]
MDTVGTYFSSSNAIVQILQKTNDSLKHMERSFDRLQKSVEQFAEAFSSISAPQILEDTQTSTNKVGQALEIVINKITRFQSKASDTTKVVGRALSSISHLASKVVEVGELPSIADSLTESNARLSFLVEDGGSVQALRDDILGVAEASRSSFADTESTLLSLSKNAVGAFSGNEEILRFAEQLNKSLAVSGTPADAQAGVREQVLGMMSGGQVSADDMTQLAAQAPMLAQSIEQYMQSAGVSGTLQSWASSGLLTADVIKNALLSTSDVVDARFAQMPMTSGQLWTSIQNQAAAALQPVLEQISAIMSSPEMQAGIKVLIGAIAGIASIAASAFGVVAQILSFVSQNLDIILPVMIAIITVLIAYQAIMAAIAVVQAVVNASNPFTLIMMILVIAISLVLIFFEQVVGGIYVVIALFQNLGITVMNFFSGLGAAIHNAWIWFQNVAVAIENLFAALVHNLGAFFNNLWKDAQITFWSFVEVLLSGIRKIADLVNNVIGVFGIQIDTSGLEGQLNWIAGQKSTLEGEKIEYEDLAAAWEKGMNTYEYEDVGAASKRYGESFQDGWVQSAYAEGSAAGAGIKNQIGDLFSFSFGSGSTGGSAGTLADYGISDSGFGTSSGTYGSAGGLSDTGAYDTGSLGAISGDTAAIRENTARSEEDLSLLREIAEREAINRFTTAEVKVDMTGMNNTIHSDMDIDGFITVFTDRFAEALTATAEGVHV